MVSRIAELQKNSYTKNEGVYFCRWGTKDVEKTREIVGFHRLWSIDAFAGRMWQQGKYYSGYEQNK
jgi:hypothetical protein